MGSYTLVHNLFCEMGRRGQDQVFHFPGQLFNRRERGYAFYLIIIGIDRDYRVIFFNEFGHQGSSKIVLIGRGSHNGNFFVIKKKGVKIEYMVGTMIEVPRAALTADEIAEEAEFFSFGTNDLTQTTLGLSRDDFTSFMPDYTLYDILSGNPFRTLEKPVKELIARAIQRGTITRPDLLKGLCGEHGAAPENIGFCIDSGLDYVSCSTYSVPISALSAAQVLIKRSEQKS